MRKILFSTLLSLLLPMTASAYDAEINGIYYNFSGDEATVTYKNTNYNSYSGQVVIPSSVTTDSGKKYSVTSIGDYAFYKCSGLTSVSLPSSLKTIGGSAFNSSGLTSVTIPTSVDSIGRVSFGNCAKLSSIRFEDSEKPLKLCANRSGYNYATFYGSSADKTVYVGRDLQFDAGLSSSSSFASATSVEFGEKVTAINDYLFYGAAKLGSVTIGSGVNSIGAYAFYNGGKDESVDKTSVTMGSSVTEIKSNAFNGCAKMTAISLPSTLQTIGESAFSGCSKMTSIGQPSSLKTIGGSAFYSSGLTSVTIPASTDSIGRLAFGNCASLANIRFEDSEKPLKLCANSSGYSDATFYGSNADKTVYVGRDLLFNRAITSSSSFASATSVEFGDNVTAINDNLFNNSTKLMSVKVPWMTPITINRNVFSNTAYSNATLYVPGGTMDAYRADQVWKLFLNMEESSFFVNATSTGGGTLTFNDLVVRDETKRMLIDRGSDVTFEVKADQHYDFTSLTVDGEPVNVVNGIYTYTDLQSHIDVVATFTEKPKFDIKATATGGTVSLNGKTPSASQSIKVYRDTDVTLTVAAAEGYEKPKVTVNGTDVSAQLQNNKLILQNIQEAKTIVVTFAKKKFQIKKEAVLNGTIELSKTVVEWGDSFTATFKPATGYEFATATVNGKDVTANVVNDVLTVTNVKENKTVGGSFKKQTFSVTVSGDGVSVSNTRPEYGDNVTVTIDDDPDRTLVSLLVNGEDVTAQVVNGQYVITNVKGNVTVEATFKSSKEFINMTSEYAMFSCPEDLDFTDSELSAYIASGFNKATNQVLLVRVYDVPAGTGIFLIGTPGTTYKIPYSETSSYYVNLFRANLEENTIYATAGNFSNYIFGNQDGEPGFNPIANKVMLPKQTAYLQLPSSFVTAGVKVSVVFEEDIIDGIEDFRISDTDETIYDLAGRRLSKTRRGINIVNGKKTLR